jgi:DNA-binding response OmpR family regulator
MLVLVADDDPDTCVLVSAVLTKDGHSCIVARDAMQTMQMATNRKPEAIVLDLQMPAGTGVGALEKLKRSAKTSHIPVIVLSGVTDRTVIARVLQLGAVEFLPKPADPDALTAAVRRIADGPASPAA